MTDVLDRILADAKTVEPKTKDDKPKKLAPLGPEDFSANVGLSRDDVLYAPSKATGTRGTQGCSVAFCEISPAKASELLEVRNIKNRPFIASNYNAIAQAITEGRYIFKGDTLVFGSNHALLDGQNRLRAIVNGGKTVVCLVVFGVDPQYQAIMDKAKPRTHAQSLMLLGHGDTTQLGSALGTLARIRKGTYSHNSPTDERIALMEDHPELEQVWLPLCKEVPSRLGIGRVAAVAYMMHRLGKTQEARRMIDVLGVGATEIPPVVIAKNDPALKLRNWAQSHQGRIPEKRCHNTLIYVANLVMSGGTLGSMPQIINTPVLEGLGDVEL